jgi:protein-disulfide isomerase
MAPVTRILLTAFVVITALVGTGVYLSARGNDTATAAQSDKGPAGQLVREDSRRLGTPTPGAVTLVEFLDFECEACRAAYPMVERLRTDYGERLDVVVRYFPIPSHFNAERAARAVESAAQQGRFEAMYKKMYETQANWGERQTPADVLFREFATELGLDMALYDAAYNDPATLERVKVDVADGKALGVKGTPTFFLNGDKLKFNDYEELSAAVERSLNQTS